jgi:hypothetical protein
MEALLPGSASIRQRFDVHVIRHADHRPTRRGDLTITPYEVRHASGAPAYAVRVDGLGASVAYSGDTELTDALLDAADGTDLVLCEGYRLGPLRGIQPPARQLAPRPRKPWSTPLPHRLQPEPPHPPVLASDLSEWHTAHDGLHLVLPWM